MTGGASFTSDEAKQIGSEIGVDWSTAAFDVEQFRMGLDVELEHGLHDPVTDVTNNDPVVHEFPDYYTRLARMEEEARREAQAR